MDIGLRTRAELVWVKDESGKRTDRLRLVKQVRTVGPKGGERWEGGEEAILEAPVSEMFTRLAAEGWSWTGETHSGKWWEYKGKPASREVRGQEPADIGAPAPGNNPPAAATEESSGPEAVEDEAAGSGLAADDGRDGIPPETQATTSGKAERKQGKKADTAQMSLF